MRIALLLCRWLVGLAFICYGLVKILGGQFYHGDWVIDSRTTDPTTIVWCFFGYSPVYARLIGLGEFVPGLMLLFPRTKTLGAAALLPVTLNITVMDFCFGFPPVKYTSLLLTVLTAALVASDWRKFRPLFWDDARLELLARVEAQEVVAPAAPRSWWRTIFVGLFVLVVGVPLLNLVALNATPGPEQAAVARCVEEGWDEATLAVRGWRRTGGDYGIDMTAEVEVAAGRGESLRVHVRRPTGFVSWRAVRVERLDE